jgi:superfamily II DNA/RNA helicase
MSPTVDSARAIAPASTSFAELGVPERIVRALDARGITEAFPIQSATLPDSLDGRDVIGRGRTGSGKTIAFAIPTVVTLWKDKSERSPKRPRGLILVPTRELAAQVAETLVPLATALGMHVAVIHGGVSAGPQIKALMRADIVVACPGRLEDLIAQRQCRLDDVLVTVLDEADHMADLGFLPAVKRLLDQTPQRAQRLLFSATLDNGVDQLVRRYLHNPVTHSVDPVESPVPDMEHHVLYVAQPDKAAVVRMLASGTERRLLFTRTKHGATKLAQQLTMSGIPSVELHGNLSQNARTRNLEMFTTGEARVLVATDIAARGIHVDDITLVVHVDPPEEHKAFLHRSGRTARAGAAGTVVTVATNDQRRDVEALTRRAGIRPTVTQVAPGHRLLDELTGEVAEHVAPRPQPAQNQPPRKAASGAPKRGGSKPGGSNAAGAARPSGRPTGRPAGRTDGGRSDERPQGGDRPAKRAHRGQGGQGGASRQRSR